MPLYESVFIARQDISGAQVDTLADGFAEIVAKGGGQIAKREYWGLRNLSYRIKKNRKGHYVLFNIDAPSDAVHEMERLMRINDDILRFMTLRVDGLEAEPSAMMQGKSSERRERADRGDEGRDGRDGREVRGDRDGRDGRGERDGRSERDGRGERSERPAVRAEAASEEGEN